MKIELGDFKLYNGKGKTYALLYHMTSIVHIIYMLVFYFEDSKVLAGINAVLAIFYFIVGCLIVNAISYKGLFAACTVAMTAFLILHYIMLGPSFGFQYLSIGMIPFMFFLAYVNGGGADIAKWGSIAAYVVLIIVSSACSGIDYQLVDVSENSRRVIVLINLTITFGISIRFMTEFVKKTYADTSILENKNLDMEKSANIDALTGLLNRRTIETGINRALFRARGEGHDFTLLMCDIDNFKHVNDTYGHDCGDQVLRNIASIIKNEVRADDVVYRWGGEEILIIVSGGAYIARNVAERCRKSIEESVVVYEGVEIRVTITIGGASYYQGASRDDLVNRADKHLYEGKHSGKNQVVI